MTLIFVTVGCCLCWQNTFIGHNSKSNNPEVTKEKVEFLTESQNMAPTQKQKLYT